MFCGGCGRAMVGQQASNRPGAYYTCGDKRHPPSTRRGLPHGTYCPAEATHVQVQGLLRQLLGTADLSAHLPAPEPRMRDDTAALAELDTRLRRVKLAYEEGVDSSKEYREKKGAFEATRHGILTAPLALDPKIDPQHARRLLQEALTLSNLHDTAVRLGLRVQIRLDGGLSVRLDPVI